MKLQRIRARCMHVLTHAHILNSKMLINALAISLTILKKQQFRFIENVQNELRQLISTVKLRLLMKTIHFSIYTKNKNHFTGERFWLNSFESTTNEIELERTKENAKFKPNGWISG